MHKKWLKCRRREAQSYRFKSGMDTKAEKEKETMEAAGVGTGS